MKTVFISSTARDLSEFRRAVSDAIMGLDGYHPTHMANFGARDSEPDEHCRREVGRCDLFIGLIGQLHGSCPPGSEQSFTEREYLAAGAAGKSRLMFLTADDFPMSGLHRESDRQWELQRSFRDRVRQAGIHATFRTADELTAAVIKAVRNWEAGHTRPAVPSPPDAPGASETQHHGRIVPLMCDRKPQDEEFKRIFRENYHRQIPQIYLLHGDEREASHSFVHRLYETRIKSWVSHVHGRKRAASTESRVPLPVDGDLDARERALRLALFERLDPRYEMTAEDFSAPALCDLARKRHLNLVMFHHPVDATRWDAVTAALLKAYVEFWATLADTSPRPQFLVFVDVRYPSVTAGGVWAIPGLQQLLHFVAGIRVKRTYERLPSPPSCLVSRLEELGCVEIGDVVEWQEAHGIGGSDKKRFETASRLFPRRFRRRVRRRHMMDLEPELEEIQSEDVNTRGRLHGG